MSDANKILDERLAKGDIDEAEYDRLVAKLSDKAEDTPPKPPSEKLHQSDVSGQQPASDSVAKTEEAPAWLAKLLGLGAIYLIICIVMAFTFPKGFYYERVLKGCGSNNAFCHCVAETYSDQVSFLLRPFQSFGMLIDKGATARCRQS